MSHEIELSVAAKKKRPIECGTVPTQQPICR